MSEAATESLRVLVRVRRFDPEEERSFWQEYPVAALPSDRILDVLHKIKWEQDGSLTFRRSCGEGTCGSDAMRINGRNRLACKTWVKDVNVRKPITIEPMKGLPVLRDLIVDMEPFYASQRAIEPYLVAGDEEAGREPIQSPEQLAMFEDTTKCILCGACTTACPVAGDGARYLGPAAIVTAHRFIFDSRDHGGERRLDLVGGSDGVWRCQTVFNCTEACPVGIEVTSAIQQVRRRLVFGG